MTVFNPRVELPKLVSRFVWPRELESEFFAHFGTIECVAGALDLKAKIAFLHMIIDQPHRLHQGVSGDGSDKAKTTRFQVFSHPSGFGDCFGDCLASQVFGQTALVGFVLPDKRGERAEFRDDFERARGVIYRGANLLAIAHDAFIFHQPRDVRLAKLRHIFHFKARECLAKRLAFSQDYQPTQSRLKTLQTEFLKEVAIFADGLAPFVVVVILVEFALPTPTASASPVDGNINIVFYFQHIQSWASISILNRK